MHPLQSWAVTLLALLTLTAVPAAGSDQPQRDAPTPDWFDVQSAKYPPLPVEAGRGGAFIGTHQKAVIVAGGSTFDRPGWEGGTKQYHHEIFVLVAGTRGARWIEGGQLPDARAHGATVSTPEGVICFGGENADGTRDDALLIQWDPVAEAVTIRPLDARLPMALKDATATYVAANQEVYLAGGLTAEGEAVDLFARAPLARLLATTETPGAKVWTALPAWPGPERFGAALVAQFDGFGPSVFLLGGQSTQDNAYRTDAFRYDTTRGDWHALADLPRPALLAPHAAMGQAHIVVASGSDGHDVDRWQDLRDDYHFPRAMLVYHTITDTWVTGGDLDVGVAGSTIVPFEGEYLVLGGEVRPTVRTDIVQSVTLIRTSRFSTLDYVVLTLYLLLLVGIGYLCAKRGTDTNDFFLAGKRIPWWAAGLSLMATQVSSIGFMATPAKTFATDWLYFAGVATWFIVVPIITMIFIPFFCRLNVTSAYEYLESRFNLAVRLLAAAVFSLLQLGRVAIVLFLPALALSEVIGIDIMVCIVVMGVLTTIYTVAGGMEAVVWTDVVQALMLLGGAAVCIGVVIFGIDGGPSRFIETAFADNKFRMIDMRWDYTAPVLWVILVGSGATRLANLTSDQSLVQRYLSTSSVKEARRALWIDVWVSIPWAVLIFLLGTALYVYYKTHPGEISPAVDVNGIVPMFVAHSVPAGLSGLIVAAIFAASMSSVDSAVHSVATVVTTDFYQRFRRETSQAASLWMARAVTGVLGILSTASAMLIAVSDIRSIWDLFIEILGLGVGILAGIFLLGVFTKRGNGPGAVVGVIAGAFVLYIAKYHTDISFWLYPAIGIASCWGIGYIASLPFAHVPVDLEESTVPAAAD